MMYLSGCEIINPEEPIPAYINIEETTLATDYTSQGTNSGKITDVWFYVNQNLTGVYELPVKFPVLAEGMQEIQIKAGIMDNGIAATRSAYSFYTVYTGSINLTKGETIKIIPSYNYASYSKFLWLEDFEDPGVSITPTGSSVLDTLIRENNENQFEQGKYAAMLSLNDTINYFEFASNEELTVSRTSPAVYLELNYLNNIEFITGILVNNAGSITKKAKLVINPSASWNKIYINFTPDIFSEPTAATFRFFFSGTFNDTIAGNKVLIDNIKLVN